MRSEVDNKKWGTIYLGGNQETTLDSLDTMQAATRQEQWNQRTQNDYLERVRVRATDRAREILGAAHTERQNLLAEARTDAERIRLETQVQYAKADDALAQAAAVQAEAEALRDEATALRDAARQEGFDQGLANARDELDNFRGAMGASIAVVLQTIERQNGAIFDAWREEVTALVQTCVEKGTEWVLDNQHAAILRALVIESVRKLDDRHTVTLRVHPDDEAAVADMFAAAREAVPDVERWIVNGDPTVELGGLIVESPSSTVDNRLDLRRTLVNNVLQHLTLPEGEADLIAAAAVHDVVAAQVAHIAEIAPPMPEPELDSESELKIEAAPAPETAAQPEALETPPDAPEQGHKDSETPLAAAEIPPEEDFQPNTDAFADMAAQLRAAEVSAPEFAPVLAEEFAEDSAEDGAENFTEEMTENFTEDRTEEAPLDASLSSLEALERELLPLPEEELPPPPVNSAQLDEVLSGGGFITEPEPTPSPAPSPELQP